MRATHRDECGIKERVSGSEEMNLLVEDVTTIVAVEVPVGVMPDSHRGALASRRRLHVHGQHVHAQNVICHTHVKSHRNHAKDRLYL